MPANAVIPSGGPRLEEALFKATDETLLRKTAVAGDARAFEVLVHRHKQAIYGLALHLAADRMLAEDIVQETLLDSWRTAGRFDCRRGSARSWLLRIAFHKALSVRSRRRREDSRQRRQLALARPCHPVALPETRVTEARELSDLLGRLVGQLTEADRRLVALYFGEECSQDEIARLLRMPQRTISRRLTLSLHSLRKGMRKAGLGVVGGEGWPLDEALRPT